MGVKGKTEVRKNPQRNLKISPVELPVAVGTEIEGWAGIEGAHAPSLQIL